MSGSVLLLDSNVLLYSVSDGLEAARFRPIVEGKSLAVSFAAAGEIVMLARRSPNAAAERAVAQIVLGRIIQIGYDDRVSQVWGELAATASRTPGGRVRHTNDLWTAAVALRHGLPLVTNNRTDFDGIPGLRLLP